LVAGRYNYIYIYTTRLINGRRNRKSRSENI
jgi:hypothetical protein